MNMPVVVVAFPAGISVFAESLAGLGMEGIASKDLTSVQMVRCVSRNTAFGKNAMQMTLNEDREE